MLGTLLTTARAKAYRGAATLFSSARYFVLGNHFLEEHFVEMPPHVRPRPSSSQLAGNDGTELQSPTADRLVGHDATLGQHILDVAIAQSEAEIDCWMTRLG